MGYDRYNEFTHDLYYQIRGKVLFEPAEMPETRAFFSYSFSHDDPYVRDIGGPAGSMASVSMRNVATIRSQLISDTVRPMCITSGWKYEDDKWNWTSGVYFAYEDEKNFYNRTIPLSATINRN